MVPIRFRRIPRPIEASGADHAILLLAHGSRCFESLAQLDQLAEAVALQEPEHRVETAFLQLSDPEAAAAIAALADAGCKTITVIPLLLLRATHARVDVPGIVEAARVRHPFVEITLTNGLGPSNSLQELAAQRITRAAGRMSGSNRKLIIVSQGSSNELALGDVIDASVEVASLTGASSVTNAFARAADPSVEDVAFSLTTNDDVVVFYWVLFHGKLVEDARGVFANCPATVTDAGFFGPDPTIVDLISQRLDS